MSAVPKGPRELPALVFLIYFAALFHCQMFTFSLDLFFHSIYSVCAHGASSGIGGWCKSMFLMCVDVLGFQPFKSLASKAVVGHNFHAQKLNPLSCLTDVCTLQA